jgi:hypothetical protein
VKWIGFVGAGLVGVVVLVAAIGAALPRNHKASRTLRLRRTPEEIWPVVTQMAGASSVPVEVVEQQAPRRLVTRVKETEKNFGGTWTIAIEPVPDGSTLTITEDGWVANPVFRFVSRFVMGHHATMDAILTRVAAQLNEEPALSGE